LKNNFFKNGFFAHDVLNLSAREAYELCDNSAFLVDVREMYLNNFKMFRVKNIIYLPFSELAGSIKLLPLDIPLIFADAVGLHSREAVLLLSNQGYRNVANLSGGIVDWEQDGMPVTTDKEYRLSGSCMCQLKTREAGSKTKTINMEQSIGFIGGGRITRILLQAFRNKNVRFKDIVVTDPNSEALEKLKNCDPTYRIADPATAAAQDIVFISLHPPVIMDSMESIKNNIRDNAIVISLAPKITLSKIAMKLGHVKRLARIIPNATSFINEGYNPICFGQDFPEPDRKMILDILGNLGQTFEVPESKLESYAIISAMLPTYFWFQWQELTTIGQKIGLSENESRESVNQTILASLDLMFKSGLKTEEVIDLIPVKPIGENETQIREIYNTKLTSLYEKIKP
jgi:pyrroline-5-carboxylate reductase